MTPDQEWGKAETLRMLEKANVTQLDAVVSQFGFEPLRFAENCDYLLDY